MALKEELFDKWLALDSKEQRRALFEQIKRENLFPNDDDLEKKYGLYPSIDDENFLVKLFHKKEFLENHFKSTNDLATCEGKVEFELNPVQRFVSNYLSGKTPYNSALLYHGVGVGKCHGKDTPILMHDGSIKKIQDIIVGDMLMGDDSTPRNVLSLARGRDMMFEIKTVKGDSYVVNSEHILSLKYTGTDNVIDVSLDKYLNYSNKRKSNLKGYHTGVKFEAKEVPFDPYILGVWLGDGSQRDPVISSQDCTILNYLRNYTLQNNLSFNYQSGYDYRISSHSRKEENTFLTFLKKNNLINNKHIPNNYKINDENIRLQVLAGLIDTDGYLVHGTYEIIQKSKQLSDDIVFLARSLGFMTTTKCVLKSCTYKNKKVSGYYYRTFISGNINKIPVKIERKKAPIRKQKKDVLKHGFEVVALGENDYYGFTLDGNHRYVLGNFIVTHNTCSAVSIAEAYLYINPKSKVFIVAPPNIQPNFLRTIFDIDSVIISENPSIPNKHNGCTGSLYLEMAGCEYEKDIKIIQKKVKALVQSRYELMGYIQLSSYIERIVSRVSPAIKDQVRRKYEENKLLNEEFSGGCMIIDEAHNLRDVPGGETKGDNMDAPGGESELNDAAQGKKLTPNLKRVLGLAEHMKLVLLTATPMYNSYIEIIYLLNLLLLNDGKLTLNQPDVFNTDGTFAEGGEEKLSAAVKAYVSFLRGETPISFPIRLPPPKNIKTIVRWPTITPDNKPLSLDETSMQRLTKLNLIPVTFGDETYKSYIEIINSSIEANGIGVLSIDTLVQSGNWIYPSVSEDVSLDMRIRDSGFDNCFDGKVQSTRLGTRYASKLGAPKWLLSENIVNYSPKTAFILKQIRNTKGPVFIYSRFINSGALPIALALEANGYTLYGRDRGLLYDGIQTEEGRQCALCSSRERRHVGKDHEFAPAKYVLLTGRKDISPNNTEAIVAERLASNYNGSNIKVVVGSQVASEGIDLKYIREIYVFDSWYHLNKMEQVLGRGVRTCSHIHPDIPETERNTTIYLLVNQLKENRESIDMHLYRIGMLKSLQISKITRLIKENAIDCNLNKNVNYIFTLDPRLQINGQQYPPEGETINVNDQDFSSICDYMECEFNCSQKINLNVTDLDISTYDEYTARWRETKIKQDIKRLFEEGRGSFSALDLIEGLTKVIPEEALFGILKDIINNKSFPIKVFNKEGYIIFRNGYLLFQPFIYEMKDIPLAIRIADIPVKQDNFIPSKELVEEVKKAEIKHVETSDKDIPLIYKFWEAIVMFSTEIQNGMYKKSFDDKLPVYLLDIINKKFKDSKETIKHTEQKIQMCVWLYTSIKDNPDFRKILAYVFLEFIWDNILSYQEQQILIKKRDPLVLEVAKEQDIEDGKYFRHMNFEPPYDIKYWKDDKIVPAIISDMLERSTKDEYNNKYINNETTGAPHGYLTVLDKRFIFKVCKNVYSISTEKTNGPEFGAVCKDIPQIKGHLDILYSIGKTLRENGLNNFYLDEEHLNPKSGSMKVKNPVRYCTIKELILRWMDKKKIKNLKWFYRPIFAYKSIIKRKQDVKKK